MFENWKLKIGNYASGGYATLTVLVIVLVVSLTVIGGYVFFSLKEVTVTRAYTKSIEARSIAESGIEDGVYRVITGKNLQASENLVVGTGSTTITLATSGNNRTIRSEGKRDAFQNNLETTITINTTSVNFFYGVQAGDGGVRMEQNSEIIGNIYSNGNIDGDNGAKVSGDAVVAGNVEESVQARSTVCNQDQIAGQTNPEIDFAQSFGAPSNAALLKISIYIKKTGNPGDATVRIVSDNAGSPSQTSLANGTLSAGLVTTSYGWIEVVFPSPAALTQGATYWIVLDASQNNSKYWTWCKDSNNGYGNGVGTYKQDWSTGGAWTQITGDLGFKTYFGSGIHTLEDVIVTGSAWANTIQISKICGDAYYQSIDASSLDFLNSPTNPTCANPLTSGTGNPNSPDEAVAAMPISQANIDDWKSAASSGGLITGTYAPNINSSLGPTKITGDLVMSANNIVLTVTGTIYVQGNIDVSNGSSIRCAAGYGENSCIVIADGWIHIANNGIFSGSGASESYLLMLSTLACDGTSATSPDGKACGDHNGAIDLHNNASGVIFYSANGLTNLHNGVNATEITAYKLQLSQNAIITYNMGLANAKFSSGPSGGYDVMYWREVE